ncbi:RHS repeat domain-containing protein, partial [Rubritalea tangerina]
HVYAVSDDSGDILEHYRYNAFGEVEIYNTSGNELATSAIDNKVTWNSRRYDSDTKLHYYKYRHYNPTLGRWLSRDPIEERGGINLYGFVGNGSISRFDMLGLFFWGGECKGRLDFGYFENVEVNYYLTLNNPDNEKYSIYLGWGDVVDILPGFSDDLVELLAKNWANVGGGLNAMHRTYFLSVDDVECDCSRCCENDNFDFSAGFVATFNDGEGIDPYDPPTAEEIASVLEDATQRHYSDSVRGCLLSRH